MIEIEDDESGDAYVGEESVGASVIAGRDTAPILEFPEPAFDLVALAVECFVLRMLGFPGLSWRNAGHRTAFDQCGTRFVAVIAFVSDQHGRRR